MTINQVLTQTIALLNQIESELLLGLVVTSVVLFCTLLLSLKKSRKLDRQVVRMQQALKISNSSVINIGQQLLKLEQKLNEQRSHTAACATDIDFTKAMASTLKKQPEMKAKPATGVREELPQKSNDDSGSVYDNARFYLAKGDSIERVAKRCNLSHAEVSLLKALSKNTATTL